MQQDPERRDASAVDEPAPLVGSALGPFARFLVRQPLGVKFALAFGSLVALVALTGVVAARGLVGVRQSIDRAEHLAGAWLKPARDARLSHLQALQAQREFLLLAPQWGADLAGARLLDGQRLQVAQPRPEDHWASTTGATHADLVQDAAEAAARACEAVTPLDLAEYGLAGDAAAKADLQRWQNRCQAGLVRELAQLTVLANTAARALDAAGLEGSDTAGQPVRRGTWGRLVQDLGELDVYLAADATGAAAAGPGSVALAGLRMAVYDFAHQRGRSWPVAMPEAPTQTGEAGCAVQPIETSTGLQQSTQRLRASLATLEGQVRGSGVARERAVATFRVHLGELLDRDDKARAAVANWVCQAAQLRDDLDQLHDAARGPVERVRAQAAAQPGETFGYVSFFTLLIILVGAALAYALATNLRRPIRSLVQAAEQVAKGDLKAQALTFGDDEIGRLAQTFNRMTAQLDVQTRELKRHMREVEQERQRSEHLLLNILPAPIAERLKLNERPIADAFDEATVVFADVVGYTTLAARLEPQQVVNFLGKIFSRFDELAAEHGVEKIKTIGDAYMVASGLPQRTPDHCQRAARMALGMLQVLEELNPQFPQPLQLRIGLHTGPVVAGVIGERKFLYDLWGDAVNIASRMESHGEPGAIQVTSSSQTLLQHEFVLEPRGEITVKGRGVMQTWWLRAERLRPAAAD